MLSLLTICYRSCYLLFSSSGSTYHPVICKLWCVVLRLCFYLVEREHLVLLAFDVRNSPILVFWFFFYYRISLPLSLSILLLLFKSPLVWAWIESFWYQSFFCFVILGSSNITLIVISVVRYFVLCFGFILGLSSVFNFS